MERQKDGVRSSITSCLTRVLGSDQQARRVAEEELKTLEVTEDFGVVLAEITASKDGPVQYRQLASIVLKQYIESHWSALNEKFEEPELTERSKVEIKEMLPACLGDSHSKVRAAVAYTISTIARWDWPQRWPNLFDQLICFLDSGQPHLVHGTMRVLSEFCQSLLDSQLPDVVNAILPHLLKVIVQADLFSIHTRTRAVHIYNVLSGLVFSLDMSYPDSAKLLLFPTLEEYMHSFVKILSSPLPTNTDHGLRKEVIMTLCHLLRSYSAVLAPHIMTLVTPVWNILTEQTTIYVNSAVNSEQWLEETCDSDGEIIGQESSIFAVFEFINVLGESDSYQSLLLPILPQLIYLLIAHMQITQHQVSCWMESVNQFVDEEENDMSYSIRLSAFDLVRSFTEDSDLASPCYAAIVAAINKQLEENPPNSSSHWWKVHEACLLVSSVLVEGIKEREVEFEVLNFVEQVVLPGIRANVCDFLTGRCLWLAGIMASLLPDSTLLKVLKALEEALRPSEKPVLRVLAVKAIYYFCSELRSTEHAQLLKTWLPSYLSSLCELARQSPEDVVFLVVDSLQLAARMDGVITGQCSSDLVPLAMTLFLHYCHDPGISSCVEELFEALSQNPGCHACLHSHLLPTALDILESTSSQMPQGMVAGLLDVLTHVVRGCVVKEASGVPLTFIHQVFPNVVKRVLNSSDSAILQNGGECVRAFVSVAVEQLAGWHDVTARNGLHYVMELILHLLDPLLPEFSASFVGKLVVVFIKKAGSALGQDLQLLLRAVLSKMQSVNTPNVMQSLLLIFAHLIHTELEEMLSFLSQVPGPSGQPALQYVVSEWCDKHPFFFGMYESRVSTLALCQLLSHCVVTGDQRLTELHVEDSQIHVHSMRGAEDRPHKMTHVQLPVRVLKLLIHDLQSNAKTEEIIDTKESGEEDVEGTLEWLLTNAATYGGDQCLEVDPDTIGDPILQLDLQNHLNKYLVELTCQACFSSLSNHLTQSEHRFLTSLPQASSNCE